MIAAIQAGPIRMRANPRARLRPRPRLFGRMPAISGEGSGFFAGCLFAQTEGIIPAPESCHAIAAAVREARKCTESGEPKVILFNLSGHGLIDMAAYDKYLAGDLVNYSLSDEQIKRNIGELDAIG